MDKLFFARPMSQQALRCGRSAGGHTAGKRTRKDAELLETFCNRRAWHRQRRTLQRYGTGWRERLLAFDKNGMRYMDNTVIESCSQIPVTEFRYPVHRPGLPDIVNSGDDVLVDLLYGKRLRVVQVTTIKLQAAIPLLQFGGGRTSCRRRMKAYCSRYRRQILKRPDSKTDIQGDVVMD